MSAKRTQAYRFGVPAKYTAGLSPAAATRKAAEIKRTAKAYKAGKKVNVEAVSKSRANAGKQKRK